MKRVLIVAYGRRGAGGRTKEATRSNKKREEGAEPGANVILIKRMSELEAVRTARSHTQDQPMVPGYFRCILP